MDGDERPQRPPAVRRAGCPEREPGGRKAGEAGASLRQEACGEASGGIVAERRMSCISFPHPFSSPDSGG